MRDRSRTIASLFTVAMAAMLLGAVVTSQIQHPEPAFAGPEPALGADSHGGGAVTLDTFKNIARSATQGVVNINTTQEVRRGRRSDPFREFFGDDLIERFFGPQDNRRQRPQTTLGSGFVIDSDGYILTNRHVVEDADTISITLNGATYDAELIGRDARTDVALIKIEANGAPLAPLPLGDSERTEVGEWVMAIGNPFGLGGNSVTVGVVSFKGRALPLGVPGTSVDMIQTDASINPGNSGGPLLNTRGEVIGINTMIITRGLPQSSGVGFAVPINVAKDILEQLREKGRVVRGWLGVSIVSLSPQMAKTYGMDEPQGAVISDVTAGSPADRAGLRPEDVVIRVDDHDVADNSDLSSYIASKPPGTRVAVRVLRDGEQRDIEVELGTFPDQDFEQVADASNQGERLGMTLQDVTGEIAQSLELPSGTRGAVVLEVEPGETADRAGLRRGDVIVSVNGQPVAGVDELSREIDGLREDGLARLRVWRGGSYVFVILTLN